MTDQTPQETPPTQKLPEEPGPLLNPEPFAIEKTDATKNTSLVVLLLPLVFLAGLGLGYLLWGKKIDAGTTSQTTSGQTSTAQTQQAKRFDIPLDDSPAIGPANAPITLVEFSDYECPFCRKWHDEVYHRLLQDYKDKIRFIYRDYPLTGLHPNAVAAAEAADCAGEQGKYWNFHDLLFSGQFSLGIEGYQAYASSLKLDLSKFNDCLTKRRFQVTVQKNYDFASSLGIQSTPTFFINGLALVGSQPYDVFKQVIDMELAGQISK